MIYPKFLKGGSKIAILSPSGYINESFIFFTKDYFESLGFRAELYPSCINRYYQFAGTDEQRLQDLQNAMDDCSVDAIFCSRGGYGLIRIIDKLDFTNFLKSPKWIIGFSDITNLHLALNKLGVATLHSQMLKAIYENYNLKSVTSLLNLLKGNFQDYIIDINVFNRFGNVEAELIGGNLSIIYSLQATNFEINTEDKILFIEDLNEYLYHIDRMMLNLKLSGKLSKLKGLIVGSFTDIKDNTSPFGKTVCEIIHEHVSEYNYPVCFDFPAGHIEENFPLIMGAIYNMSVSKNNVTIKPIVF